MKLPVDLTLSRGGMLNVALFVVSALLVVGLGALILGSRRNATDPVSAEKSLPSMAAVPPRADVVPSRRNQRRPGRRGDEGLRALVRDYEFRRSVGEQRHQQNKEILQEASAAEADPESSPLILSVQEAKELEARGDIVY